LIAEGPSALTLPPVPLTVEGASVLHQMVRVRWPAWNALAPDLRREIAGEAAAALAPMENRRETPSAVYSLLGHKGDLLFLHLRKDFDALHQAELELRRLRLWEFLEPTTSYLSVVELSLYESTAKVYSSLFEKNIHPHSDEWNREIAETLERQRAAMAPRLWPEIPAAKYLCFYPMDRKREGPANWYQAPMSERQRMMRDHGQIGRRYGDEVRQIISGSIGFDDWEWAVDLFGDDPLAFKRLIYEMRFDEASAIYAKFGPFYIGLRQPAGELAASLNA
jgi:hydrogen peroxide-dependent heme synthase